MSTTTRANQKENPSRATPKPKREGILRPPTASGGHVTGGSAWDERLSVPGAGLARDFSGIPAHTTSAPVGLIQRVPPTGTVETSEGTEEIEGMEITSSAASIQDRLATNEDNINDRIQTWTEQGVGDLRDGIQDAANSFKLWYDARPRKPNTAEYVLAIAGAAVSVIGAAFPPAGVAAAVVGGLISASSTPIKEALDPNADPDAQARQLQQNMIRVSTRIDQAFNNFGPNLKRRQLDTWNDIGIAITMDPPLPSMARETLVSSAGVPAINQPYGERILSRMIYQFMDWEARHNLQSSRFFISAESVEYSLFTEQARRRFRRAAASEASRRLGAGREEGGR